MHKRLIAPFDIYPSWMRPTKLKLGAHVEKGLIYRVYWTQAAYSCLYLFIFLSLPFSKIKNFHKTFLVNFEDYKVENWYIHGQLVDGCTVYTRIRLLLLICPFISSLLFLSNFRILNFFVTFYQEL